MCCLCNYKSSPWSSRRAFLALAGASVAEPVLAQVDVGKASSVRKLVPAERLEAAAGQQYAQMMGEANSKKALAPANHPQVVRLRNIAQRVIPHTAQWNDRSKQWKWEVNLIASSQINAFCMPGGKIAFYTGILEKLKLDDDEVAMIMGHEMAHALREHARERLAKSQATGIGLQIGAQLLGLGQAGNVAANLGTQLLTLKYSRDDETESDLVGLELAARAAYDPQAGARLWRKMEQAKNGAGNASFLSTHPSGPDRIRKLEANAPKVQGLYEKARKAG